MNMSILVVRLLFLRKEKKKQEEFPRGRAIASANIANAPYGYPGVSFSLLLMVGVLCRKVQNSLGWA